MSKLCEICNTNEHKYKCPRCSLKTCSLKCCREHKELNNCDGQRDKVKFLAKSEFNEHELLSDYKFLEEQARLIDSAQRDPLLGTSSKSSNGAGGHHSNGSSNNNNVPVSSQVPAQFDNLRKFVYGQSDIKLKFMPCGSTRRSFNKTRFNRGTKIVSWSVEFIFHINSSASSQNLKFNTKSYIFSSKDTLRDILNQFYNKFKSDLFGVFTNDSSKMATSNTETSSSSSLILYTVFNDIFANQKFGDIQVLFQIVDYQNKNKYYIKLNLDKTFEDNLQHMTIIEYPTLFIVKNEDLIHYPIKDDKKAPEITPSTTPLSLPSKLTPKSNVPKQERTKPKDAEMEDGECDDDDEDDENSNIVETVNEKCQTKDDWKVDDVKDHEVENGLNGKRHGNEDDEEENSPKKIKSTS